MPDTTFEKAKRCPRCSNPGEVVSIHPTDRGGKVHVIFCRTAGCKWQDTSWLVEINRDGSIPVRSPGDKEFTELTETQKQMGRDMEQYYKSLGTGREIR